MLFDTPVYLLFLTLVVAAYWRLDRRRQNQLLLAASYFFYGWWDYRFLTLILISTVVDFYCARYVARSNDAHRRKLLLALSVGLNLSFLGFFKYYNFFADSLATALGSMGMHVSMPVLQIILPPGISFYTFQALAYIVDVYFKKLEPADSLLDYALFISFFPHLIAGPIQRPSHLLPQTQRAREFDRYKFFDGMQLILTGLFRKCVIADNCALLADGAFNGTLGPPSIAVLAIGTYAFAWQIYGDFSGYSDMARGAAQLMGFHFMVNFRQPYLATSLQDFWRRWHISLSTWLRDYLYIPLGGSRNGEKQTYRNLMLTMLIGGLWHGANWTFVVWGGIHGGWLALERAMGKLTGISDKPAEEEQILWSAGAWMKRLLIFHVVCLCWVFFRAQSLHEAGRMLSGLGVWSWRPEYGTALLMLAAFSVPLFLLDLLLEIRQEEYPLMRIAEPWRIASAMTMAFLVLCFAANQVNAFIYFQF